MNPFRVIIPTKNLTNAIACLSAIRIHEPNVDVIFIDDGIGESAANWLFTSAGVSVIAGEKPFCFARNVNVGIRAAGFADVIVLNDDALLETALGFTMLQSQAHQHSEYGVIAATTDICSNPNQQFSGVGLRQESRMVSFICVYIPRSTIQKVGFLDERFGGLTEDRQAIYGYCDDDYCRRVRNSGLSIAIYDGCFVNHSSLTSSFRGNPEASRDVSIAREIYRQKWGDING